VTETDRDDIDALAGEYVLGTLDADERRAAEARLSSDAGFRAAVAAWLSRLQPLADTATPIEPPDGTLERVLARIDLAQGVPAATSVVELRRSVRRWRMTSAIVGAAAAALAAFILLDLAVPPVEQSEFVAVLTSEGAAPKFVATVDVAKGTLSIRQVGQEAAPPDKSYELWAVEPGQAPESLGVIEQASLSRALEHSPSGLTLAISLEPKGGSPTGVATGPIVFSGSLVPTE
jgi:anti-sigma-K factor RskA